MTVILIGDLRSPQMRYGLEALLDAFFTEIHIVPFTLSTMYPLAPLSKAGEQSNLKVYKLDLERLSRIKPNNINVWIIRRKIEQLIHLIVSSYGKSLVVSFTPYPLLKSSPFYTVLQYLYGPAQLDHVYINTIKNPLIRKTIAFLQRGIDKETISMLQHNICLANSRFTISYISSILKNCQCELLYPPCEVQYFKIPKNRLTNKKDIVLTVGRISPEKRYELVIHLAKALKQYHFIIAGKLENWKYYASLVKLMKREEVHNVKILTNVHKSCLRELYWNSKIYVHAMRGEHFGKTVVEAMAGGCIPLVPSTGGCKEVVGRDDYTFEDDQDAVNKLYQLTSSWTEHQALEAVERSKSFDVNVYKKSFLHILRKYS